MVPVKAGLACGGVLLAVAVTLLSQTSIPWESVDWSLSSRLPWPLFSLATLGWRAVEQLPNYVIPPPYRMLDVVYGHAKASVVFALVELDIPDRLGNGAMTAEALAEQLQAVDADRVYRLLRAAKGLGFIAASVEKQSGEVLFSNNHLSSVLRKDHPNTVKDMVLVYGRDLFPVWAPNLIAHSVQHGSLAFERHHGSSLWQYLKASDHKEDTFSKAMAASDGLFLENILQDYPWSQYDRFVDVGGAYGSFLAALLRKQVSKRGTLFDLPQVVDKAKQLWEKKYPDLVSRADFVGGSFFDAATLPSSTADVNTVYILRNIIHDWDDVKSIEILSNVHASMLRSNGNATLALIESALMQDVNESLSMRLLLDLSMMLTVDGKERTKAQWQDLFQRSNLHLTRIYPTRSNYYVVEANPAVKH